MKKHENRSPATSGMASRGALIATTNAEEDKPIPPHGRAGRAHVHRRAVEAVIWGMPAVNAELMFQARRMPKRTSTRSSIGLGR